MTVGDFANANPSGSPWGEASAGEDGPHRPARLRNGSPSTVDARQRLPARAVRAENFEGVNEMALSLRRSPRHGLEAAGIEITGAAAKRIRRHQKAVRAPSRPMAVYVKNITCKYYK